MRDVGSGFERTRCERDMPEMAPLLVFESIRENSFMERIAHTLIYWLTVIDPDEKIFLPLKKYS